MLTSTSAAAKCEMNAFNSRLWRIMGIDDQTAGSYKLLPIAEFKDQVCEQTLNRILADPNHPITSCQPRNLRLNAHFPFQTRKANKAAYHNSFLQKFLRKLRNDSNSLNARASLYLQFTICLTILTIYFNNNYSDIENLFYFNIYYQIFLESI
ncbi:hypothetical protein BpHYR1_053113 [Brachionus plicatilis]|uniref:Uncharacterized protein n=1 Tax=Brachionus plicatilis TaxID=10195 RepID=A0A3M7RC73_BRAPC|nr:hypothetical protein BpHYR1_053113 [Brachionus plicatilis]